jgi:perosamine synthetase
MHELLEIGRRFGIPVIEDAAEAIGSIYFGQRAGSIGKFAVFSFHGSKTITTGEGGMFVTSDAELYERVLTLSNHGRDKNETRMFWPREVGFKYKMSNIQAALGCAQLSRVDDLVRKRQSNLEIYKNALLTLNSVSMNPDQNDCENGAWMPTLIATADQASLKKAFGVLRGNGIDVRPFFAPLSSLKFFGQRSQNKVAERLNNYGLNLPSYFDMEPIEIDFVISGVKQSFRI